MPRLIYPWDEWPDGEFHTVDITQLPTTRKRMLSRLRNRERATGMKVEWTWLTEHVITFRFQS